MKHDHETASTITAALAEASKSGRLSDEERAELERLLLAVAGGDLTCATPAETAMARAFEGAVLALGRRLCDLEREAARLRQAIDDGESEGGPADVDGSEPGRDVDEAASAMAVARGRLAEVSLLATRLGEVASQANVAALNVSVELGRDGAAKETTLTVLADEVRRLAERTDAATQRFPRVVGALEDAQQRAAELLRGHRLLPIADWDRLQRLAGRRQELAAQAAELERSLHAGLRLPGGGDAGDVESLSERLRGLLDGLRVGDVDVTAFARAVSDLDAAVHACGRPRTDEERS